MNESHQLKDEIEKRGFTFSFEIAASPNYCHRICCRKDLEVFIRQTCRPEFQREEIVLEPFQLTFQGLPQVWVVECCQPKRSRPKMKMIFG